MGRHVAPSPHGRGLQKDEFVEASQDLSDEPLIVVADDDPDILRLIDRRLRRRGYEIVTATNGLEAIHAVESNQPDAVIMDWLMPKMTGSAACEALKANPGTKAIPIILLTAKAADTDVEEGFAVGADAYLTKPFEIYELDALLKQVIFESATAPGGEARGRPQG